MYKLSQHTLFYDNYPKADESLVFNTRTQSVIQLDPDARKFINRMAATLTNDPQLSATEREYLAVLKENGIIIDHSVDEGKVLEHWFNQIKYQSKVLHATILTTYQCNFGCVYCFEERVKEPKSLDNATSVNIIEWLKMKAEENRPRLLRVLFYGGEPLMNPKPIMEIAGALYLWAKEKGMKFSFGIVTNGSLLKPGLIGQMVKIGLSAVRVTVDGSRAEHDKRRPFLDGRGSFDNIIANIKGIIDMVKVELSGNFDSDNIDSFRGLLDYLEEEKLSGKISKVLFSPIVARLGEKGNGKDPLPVEMVGCHSLSEGLGEEALKLRREVIQRGYRVERAVAVTSCPMNQDDSMIVIDPYGDIYKCTAFVGRQEFSVGNVRSANFNYRQVEFMTTNLWKECKDCAYVPMCGGGCRYMAQLKHGDCSKISCDKNYYEKIFPQLLKMDYERGALG
ncbi:MAG: SPASM domain-containing protein [Planctomycetes bacterium]|nr:SPASM domain-containing protein [Planctomycetota bacterium]